MPMPSIAAVRSLCAPTCATFLCATVLLAGALAAQQTGPALFSKAASVPAAATAWDARERAATPMLTRSRFVTVDTAAIAAVPAIGAPPLGTLTADLFGADRTLVVQRVSWTLGYRVLTGDLQPTGGQFHVVLAPDGTVSGVLHDGARSFVLARAGDTDVHVVQEFDQARTPPHLGCGVDHSLAVAVPAVPEPDLPNSTCGQPIVDMLVVYTPRARQNAGGQSAIEATIVGAVAQANAGNQASGVPIEFRLVHVAETNYNELGTSQDLGRFRNPTDGHMDEVHALRDDYGADLMHLVTDPASPSFCGVGYLMTNLSTGFSSSAFAVTVRTCIPNHTFTHEAGHNMGSHHDPANAGNALYAYSYGYRTPDNAYRTIMAYAPGQRVNRWSGPNVQYQGYTMGVAQTQDNALSLANAAATISQFFATMSPVWCDLAGGIPGAQGVPTALGAGTIGPAQPLTLTIRDYAAGAPGILIVGASAANVPLFGGTLVPAIDVAVGITGNGGDIVHDASWLANLSPGMQAWLQVAFVDGAASQGIAASDGIVVTRP